jgi:hypothetical protein
LENERGTQMKGQERDARLAAGMADFLEAHASWFTDPGLIRRMKEQARQWREVAERQAPRACLVPLLVAAV